MFILFMFSNILLSITQPQQLFPLWRKLFLGRHHRTPERKTPGAQKAQMRTSWEMSLPLNVRRRSLEKLNACLGNIKVLRLQSINLFRFTAAHEELVRKGLADMQDEAGPSLEVSHPPVPVHSSQSTTSEEPSSQEPPVKAKRPYTRCVSFNVILNLFLLRFSGRNRKRAQLNHPRSQRRTRRGSPPGRRNARWN